MIVTSMLLAALLAAGSAPSGRETTVMIYTGSDGTMLRFAVQESDLASVPTWRPEEGQAAPLDLKFAIALGRDAVRKHHPDVQEFDLSWVTLGRLEPPHHDVWYYHIRFAPVVGGQALKGGLYIACILMNGTVIEPKEYVEKRPEP